MFKNHKHSALLTLNVLIAMKCVAQLMYILSVNVITVVTGSVGHHF
jgi:hypothetical protein